MTGQLQSEESWTLSIPPAAVFALPTALRTFVTVGGADIPRLRGDLIKDIGLLVHYTVS